MSDITVRCRICWALPGDLHAQGCPAPDPVLARAPEPMAEERSELVEASAARNLKAWLRGDPMPNAPRGGYRPKPEEPLP